MKDMIRITSVAKIKSLRKKKKEILRTAQLLWICVLLLLPALACAKTALLWVSPDGGHLTEAIDWYKNDKGEMYLFLPANADVNALRVGYSGCDLILDDETGMAVSPGDSAQWLTPGVHMLRVDGKTQKLTVMQGSAGLPALYITTQSGSLDYIEKNKENREAGSLVFVSPDGEHTYDGELEHIKCRGNSSMTFPKKNYQIKLESSADLMNMGKAKKWILTSNYRDKSLLRNEIVFDVAETIGLPYTPEHMQAEVYINHEYRGVYLFSEKVEIGQNRINIADLEKETEKLNEKDLSEYPLAGSKRGTRGAYKAYDIPVDAEDITGGYLVEFESYASRFESEASAYETARGNVLVIKSPEYASASQMNYVATRLQAFENAIFSPDGKDAESGLHYDDIVDKDSLVRKYLLEEFCKNYDGNYSSQYYYKPRDEVSEKFFAGPAWDYDSSFGSYAREDNAKHVLGGEGMWIGAGSSNRLWWPALYSHSDFRQEVAVIWKSRMKPAIKVVLGSKAEGDISIRSLYEYADMIRDSYAMNSIRWPRIANPSGVVNTGNTLDKNIDYLADFLLKRVDYLSEQWE